MKLRLPLAVHQTLISAERCPILHGSLPSDENTRSDRWLCGGARVSPPLRLLTPALSNLQPAEF